MSYAAFVEEFPKRMTAVADQIREGGALPALSDGSQTVDDVIKLFDRQEIISELRGLMSQEHTSGQWVALKSQAEVLAGCERDTRSRYHSRINAYLGGADSPYLTKLALKQHMADTQFIAITT